MKVKFLPCFSVGVAIESFDRNLRTYFHILVYCLAALISAGCQPSNEVDRAEGIAEFTPQLSNVSDSMYQFEPPMMLKADGTPIAVESPGYACPTIADVDGDGVDDLVVGQFNGGKMHFYRNLSAADELPKYASQQWINTGSTPAEVPGVY